jgi:hypothetical protein
MQIALPLILLKLVHIFSHHSLFNPRAIQNCQASYGALNLKPTPGIHLSDSAISFHSHNTTLFFLVETQHNITLKSAHLAKQANQPPAQKAGEPADRSGLWLWAARARHLTAR